MKVKNEQTTADDKARRDVVINSFNKALREVYEWVLEWHAGESKHCLESRHTLGKYVRRVLTDEVTNDGDTFGSNAFGRLAQALDEDVGLLYAAIDFADGYTDEQLAELCATRRKNWVLSWSHVRALLTIKDPTERAVWLTKCAASTWTSAQLRDAIVGELRGGDKKHPGRKPAKPKGLKGLLDQVGTFTEKINSRAPNWYDPEHSASEIVSKMPAEQVSEKLRDELSAKIISCGEAILKLQNEKRDLEKAHARVTRSLAAKLERASRLAEGKSTDDYDDDEYEQDGEEGEPIAGKIVLAVAN